MNNYFLAIILVLTFFHNVVGFSQQLEVKKDLAPEWLYYHEGRFVPYRESDVDTDVVYLHLRIPLAKGQFLAVNGIEPINVFVNNKLAATGTSLLLNIDSLARAFYTRDLQVAIYQPGLTGKTVHTALVTINQGSSPGTGNTFRPAYHFRDFGILAGLLLTVLVVVIVRLNPKLAADYFSVGKIVSLREDESQLLTRIGNSTNILFYVYCSLLLGYFFMIVFHFLPDDYRASLFFEAETFWGSMLQWLKVSSVILMILIAKIILVLNFSYLFGITEVGGLHFFNWVRMIVVFFGALTAVLFVYFISHGSNENTHGFFLKLVVWFTGGWMVLIFLKLGGRANVSMFHLFSYICATEVIPFLLIIKVLYN